MTNLLSAEPNFLTDSEARGRLDAFRAGAITLERAADCGLLALAVPPAFGGLFISRERRAAFHDLLYKMPDVFPVRAQLLGHLAVCQYVVDEGTAAQHDFFLPQLAAGKRVGLLTKTPITAAPLPDSTAYRLSGRTTPLTNLPAAALVLVRASLEGTPRLFLLHQDLVRPDWNTAHDSYHFVFAGKRVPADSRLGAGAPVGNTEKWEATRWNHARSVY